MALSLKDGLQGNVSTAPLPPGVASNKISIYYTNGTTPQKIRVTIMAVGKLL